MYHPRTLRPAIRLTLRQLQIFAAIAKSGSTIAAAEAISLSQSATSAALNELESLLGGKLFDRAGGRLVLNEHGRSMLPQVLSVLDGARGIESQFGAAGRPVAPLLRIAASTTIGNYVLPGLVAKYRRKEPLARFDVVIGNTQRVALAVASFEVDLGFVEGPALERSLKLVPWMTDELVVVCSPGHALAAGKRKVSLRELGEASWLLREMGSGTREVVEVALLPHLQQLRSGGDFGSAEAIKQAAAEGLGITCLSRYAVADLVELGRLVVLRTALPPLSRPFYVALNEERHLTPALERFLGYCQGAYRRSK